MSIKSVTTKASQSITAFPIYRPVTTVMIFLTLIVFGWRSYQRLPISLMPEISYPSLTVRTEYEGAAPEDVEKLVTRPLEEMLSIVSGLVEISSVSSAGLSEITLEFLWNTDMNIAQQDVRDRLDLFEPPKEITKKPVILRFNPNLDPVIRIGITPPDGLSPEDSKRFLTTLRESVQRKLKNDLEAEVGIAQVVIKGGLEEEIQILVDSKSIKSLGITLDDIVRSLAAQNINVAGGKLIEGKTEYIVRTLKEFKDLDDIRNVIILTPANLSAMSGSSNLFQLPSLSPVSPQQSNISRSTPLRLKDVATVQWGNKERETIIRINGKEAIELEVYKEGDANTVTVCNLVKDLLNIEREKSLAELIDEQLLTGLPRSQSDRGDRLTPDEPSLRREQIKKKSLLASLPPGVNIHIISDQSQFIINSIKEVQKSAIQGGLLALLILYLFLHDLRSTITIGFAIPISVITVFIPMFMRGISLNIMSLGGLALGVGMLVDNSIVVLESIFRCREEGDSVIDSALRGTHEVSSAVIASTLTTVAVFFPVSFVEGIAGQLFGDLALTVTFSLLASLLVALFLNPLMVIKSQFDLSKQKVLLRPFNVFKIHRSLKKQSYLTSILSAIRYSLRNYIRYTKSKFLEVFQLPSTNNKLLFITFITISPIIFTVKLFSWFIICFVWYPSVFTFILLALPILSIFSGVLFLIKKFLQVLLFIPLSTFNFIFNLFRNLYKFSLENSLTWAPLFLLLGIALFFYALSLLPYIGQELIPPMKQGEFTIQYETRPGTKLEQTLEKVSRIETILTSHPLIERVTLQVGTEMKQTESRGKNENKASFTVLLKNRSVTTRYQDKIIEELRNKITPLPEESILFTLPTLFTLRSELELQIFGDDLNTLRAVGQKCLEEIKSIPGVKDAKTSLQAGYPELLIQLDRELIAEKGLTPAQIANKLRTEIQGEVATKFNRGGDKIDIRVRTDQALLKNLEDLKQLPITEGTGIYRLCDVATIKEELGPSDIRRIGQKRVAVITANIEGRDLASVSKDVIDAIKDVEKPREFFFTLGGQNKELISSYQSLRFALLLAIFLVYVVMASQFESIWLPLLVMFSVPLAFIGVIFAIYFTGTNLSVTVFLGSIVLAGIVVNNAIVLIDYTNQLLERGLSLKEAIVQSATVRLRPILMTTTTTVLGLIPMLVSKGEGSELRSPLAMTVMAGLLTSTFLTLWIIPMANYMFSSLLNRKHSQ